MTMCEYGCGQEAIHQFKNGKWCCSETISGCPIYRKNQSIKMSNENNPMYGKKRVHSEKARKLKSKSMMGSNNPMYGKKSPNRLTLKKIKWNYPIFFKEEQLRHNKFGDIQVHCKNHNCPNSKEKSGWFIPTRIQLSERIRQLETQEGNGGSYFYCSQQCKDECILYNLHFDPNKESEIPYTQEEYNIWKQVVLEQDKYECQYCQNKNNLNCHHIQPVKTHPHLALDPTNGIVLCKVCHYKIGHKDECSTGNLANINQSGCKLGSTI